MDQPKSVTSAMLDADRSESGWGGNRWTTWGGLGLLAATVLLPFGWILPIARLARLWATARRTRNFYSN